MEGHDVGGPEQFGEGVAERDPEVLGAGDHVRTSPWTSQRLHPDPERGGPFRHAQPDRTEPDDPERAAE
jgi:hypothetical protein